MSLNASVKKRIAIKHSQLMVVKKRAKSALLDNGELRIIKITDKLF